MSDVDMAVGIGQGVGDEDLPHGYWLLRMKGKREGAKSRHYSEDRPSREGGLGRNPSVGGCWHGRRESSKIKRDGTI